jgi:eukaryotic-like serine/threonine-protein kinase
LAMIYEAVGRLPDAIQLSRETLVRGRANLGPTQIETLDSMFLLARLSLKANRPLFVEFLAGVRKKFGADDPHYAAKLASVGAALLEHQLFAEAEIRFRECLALRVAKAPDDWAAFDARSLLGESLAEPLLVAGYEGLRRRTDSIPAASKNRLPAAVDRLLRFYMAADKPDEVAKWKAERTKYPAAAAK